jgi:hypothetical protein
MLDMGDYHADAAEDEAVEAELRRMKAADEEDKVRNRTKLKGDTLRETLASTVGEESHHLDKVVRAIERTDAGSGRQGWYFFTQRSTTRFLGADTAFPAEVATRICGMRVSTPEDLDMTALDLSLKLSRNQLPDELFAWLLDEICVEQSDVRRDEYWKGLWLCSAEDFRGHVNRGSLERLFRRLGATADIGKAESTLPTMDCPKESYYRRRWSCLRSVLDILYEFSRDLEIDVVEYCVQMLLRLAVDDEVLRNPEVAWSYRRLLSSMMGWYRENVACGWDEFVRTHVSWRESGCGGCG